jgi:hypothetical protein
MHEAVKFMLEQNQGNPAGKQKGALNSAIDK